MNDLARSENSWFETDRGKNCLDPSILRNRADTQYLRNRLIWAFRAGWEAHERCRLSREQDEKESR